MKYKVKGKSSWVQYYIGIIEEICQSESWRQTSTTFVYSIANDIDEVLESDIVSSLPQPMIGRRGQLVFGIAFNQYNLKN